MICKPCRRGGDGHSQCKGGTWCDCQHKPRPVEVYENAAPGQLASTVIVVDTDRLGGR